MPAGLESYFIELTADQLTNVGLPLPRPDNSPGEEPDLDGLRTLERRLKSDKLIFDGKAALFQTHIEREHQQHAQKRAATFTVNVKEELSLVPKALRASSLFVGDGESIHDKGFTNTVAQVKAAFNDPILNKDPDKMPLSTGFIYLTQAQIAEYQPFIQGDEFVLPGDVIERDILPQLFRGNTKDGSANDFLMDHPTVRLCARITRGDPTCAVDPEQGNGGEEGGEPQVGEEPLQLTKPEDVFGLIARQLQHASAPEGIVNFGVEPKGRATRDQIGQSIGKLQFEKGPADTTAFYDFHKVHIAFHHVWKEATDLGLLQMGEALYDEVVGAGKKPFNLNDLRADIQSTLFFLNSYTQQETPPPVEVIFEFPEAVKVWSKMHANERTVLFKLAAIILGKYKDIHNYQVSAPDFQSFLNGTTTTVPYVDKGHLVDNNATDAIGIFRQRGQRILSTVYERLEESEETITELQRYKRAAELSEILNNKLKERYSFTHFAADGMERSVNFGILLTYRQFWEPVHYQPGELVRTIPLAPKEIRKYSKRTVIKKTRSRKEIEDNLRITKTDSSETNRAESEIVDKAKNKNEFTLHSTSQFDIPLSEGAKIGNTVTTNTKDEAERESNQTKKDFRESILKAAQEYKNERRVEITDESTYESEVTESGEISNPNDELTVTYLFYELQRVFRINERLHRIRPVIFVAQEMPAPHEIDDAWIIRHDWILKRALPDDSFLYAFDCITHIRGDRLMLEEFQRTVREQRKIVNDLRQNVSYYTDETGHLSRLMQAAINNQANIAADGDWWDGIPVVGGGLDVAEGLVKGVGNLLGMGDDPQEAGRIRREGAQDAYERADRERRELMGRLEREVGVLNGLTRQVAEKLKELNEKELLIARLKNHIKDNILHFMQAIWTYEHPDQRFFRLFKTEVPQLTTPPEKYNLRIKVAPAPAAAFDEVVNLELEDDQRKTRHVYSMTPEMEVVNKTLVELADLDNFLGYKGNYAIFPLLKSNVLTDFMMAPYIDTEFGLLDPDAPGNWTLEEFDQLYCCLRDKLGDRFAEIEPALKQFYKELLLDPLRPGELISVPTGSLFIEALPGEHPIIEDFKLLHRAVDVKKVQAEVRKLELENLRYASRILAGQREDPEIDKKIIVEKTEPVIDVDA